MRFELLDYDTTDLSQLESLIRTMLRKISVVTWKSVIITLERGSVVAKLYMSDAGDAATLSDPNVLDQLTTSVQEDVNAAPATIPTSAIGDTTAPLLFEEVVMSQTLVIVLPTALNCDALDETTKASAMVPLPLGVESSDAGITFFPLGMAWHGMVWCGVVEVCEGASWAKEDLLTCQCLCGSSKDGVCVVSMHSSFSPRTVA